MYRKGRLWLCSVFLRSAPDGTDANSCRGSCAVKHRFHSEHELHTYLSVALVECSTRNLFSKSASSLSQGRVPFSNATLLAVAFYLFRSTNTNHGTYVRHMLYLRRFLKLMRPVIFLYEVCSKVRIVCCLNLCMKGLMPALRRPPQEDRGLSSKLNPLSACAAT